MADIPGSPESFGLYSGDTGYEAFADEAGEVLETVDYAQWDAAANSPHPGTANEDEDRAAREERLRVAFSRANGGFGISAEDARTIATGGRE